MRLTLFVLSRADGRRVWRRLKLRLRGWPWTATDDERDTWQKTAASEISSPDQYRSETSEAQDS